LNRGHCRTRPRRQDEGFSLLEAIVAFAMLSMVLIASIGFFGDGMKRIQTVLERNRDMDELRNAIAMGVTDAPKLETNREVIIVRRALTNVESGLTPVLVTVSITNDGSGFQTPNYPH
jgi:type II secretory pathway pseudopilin PulG